MMVTRSFERFCFVFWSALDQRRTRWPIRWNFKNADTVLVGQRPSLTWPMHAWLDSGGVGVHWRLHARGPVPPTSRAFGARGGGGARVHERGAPVDSCGPPTTPESQSIPAALSKRSASFPNGQQLTTPLSNLVKDKNDFFVDMPTSLGCKPWPSSRCVKYRLLRQ